MATIQVNTDLYTLETPVWLTLVYSENSTCYAYDSIMKGDINLFIKLVKLSVIIANRYKLYVCYIMCSITL